MKKLGLLVLLVLLTSILSAGMAWAEPPGTVEGEGTHFEIIDSEYLNITVDTTVAVDMYLTSVPESIFYNITPVSTDISTTLTIGGLAPGTTYYLYEDGQSIYSEITTDAAGQVSYVQDLSAPHIAYIFETPQDMTPPQMPGGVEGEGTNFEITDSDYLNVTVDSVEPVRMRLSSIANTVTMDIEPITAATSTQLTIGSLLPGTTYYKYEDDLHNGVAITTDAVGSYTYTQDLTTPHHVMILMHHSTKFIKDDATGGDCTSIGIWDAATKTCTLTTDLTETVQIDNDGITLDGNGHSITGSGWGWGYGVYGWRRSELTIKNLNISGFAYGIDLHANSKLGSPYALKNNTITNNTISSRGDGIHVGSNCSNTVITYNIITMTSEMRGSGIDVIWGGPARVENNYVEGGSYGAGFGFNHVTLRNNFFYNAYNCAISGASIFSGDISYNTIQDNDTGTLFIYWSMVHIHHNNFVNNRRQAVEDEMNNRNNQYYRNYWSDYDTLAEGCYDNDANGYCDAPRPIEEWGGDILEYDAYPSTQKISSAYPNLPLSPVADAGPDQTVECPATEAVQVTLDGSGSYDPNGDALNYTWSGPFGTATEVNPTVTLPNWGTWLLPLTVDDGMNGTDMDEVAITVGDTIAPTTTASVIGVKDATGKYTTDVTVILTAADSCTGIGEIHYTINGVETVVSDVTETSFTLTEDGTYYITYWSVDKAGRQSTTGSATFNATPSAGGGGGGGGGYSCIDLDLLSENTEGVLVYSLDGGLTWDAYTSGLNICPETPTVTVSYGYRSPTNNVENVKTLVINIQKTSLSLILPDDITTEATSNAGAVVDYNASAPGAVSFGCTPASGSIFAIDITTVNCTAADSAGNSTSGSFTVTVQDTTPPELTCPADISVLVNTPPTDPAIKAFLSGASAVDLVDQDVDISNDAPSSYGTPDSVTVTFTATDDYSNSSTCSAMVSVIYNFVGFLTPVTLNKPFKAGSTIPVKFQLTEYGGDYSSTAHAEIAVVQLSGTEPVGDPIDGTTNVPDSGNLFRYDLTDNHYIYNLSTDGFSVGEWQVVVTLDDWEAHTINIGIK